MFLDELQVGEERRERVPAGEGFGVDNDSGQRAGFGNVGVDGCRRRLEIR